MPPISNLILEDFNSLAITLSHHTWLMTGTMLHTASFHKSLYLNCSEYIFNVVISNYTVVLCLIRGRMTYSMTELWTRESLNMGKMAVIRRRADAILIKMNLQLCICNYYIFTFYALQQNDSMKNELVAISDEEQQYWNAYYFVVFTIFNLLPPSPSLFAQT